MKLKTFSPVDDSLAAMVVGNRKADLAHDAAYAHALVMAMDHLEKSAMHGSGVLVATASLKKRAEELMKSWGYEE